MICIQLGASCALYMPCELGPCHTVIITVKSQDRPNQAVLTQMRLLLKHLLFSISTLFTHLIMQSES